MEADETRSDGNEEMRELKHDIKNQLSGMILCLEQLRDELHPAPPDWKYYLDSIGDGCDNIIKILDKKE